MKNITILGATGSIGLNTLDVVSRHPDQFSVFAVSAHSDWKSLVQICKDHQPSFAVLSEEASAEKLRAVVSPGVQVLCGEDSLDKSGTSKYRLCNGSDRWRSGHVVYFFGG